MANKSHLKVVVFNENQNWCTDSFEANLEELCTKDSINYSCHCWAWKLSAWNGTELKLCESHSGRSEVDSLFDQFQTNQFIDSSSSCPFAAFYEDGQCYDTCWLNTKEAKEEKALQAAAEKEAKATDIETLKVYNPTLRPEDVEKAHTEFLGIVKALTDGKLKLIEIMQNITKIQMTSSRYEREPLFMSYTKVARSLEERLIQLRSQLHSQGLGQEDIDKHPEVIELVNEHKKAKERLETWTSKIGRAGITKQLEAEIAARESLAAQISGIDKNIKRDCIPYLYEVLEGYINAKENPTLRKKYSSYLEVYEKYLPRKLWVISYHNRKKQMKDSEDARQAMKSDCLASVVTRSVIDTSKLVVRENGKSEIRENGNQTIIAGGSMLGLGNIYKASTPTKTPEKKEGGPPPSSKVPVQPLTLPQPPQARRGRGNKS